MVENEIPDRETLERLHLVTQKRVAEMVGNFGPMKDALKTPYLKEHGEIMIAQLKEISDGIRPLLPDWCSEKDWPIVLTAIYVARSMGPMLKELQKRAFFSDDEELTQAKKVELAVFYDDLLAGVNQVMFGVVMGAGDLDKEEAVQKLAELFEQTETVLRPARIEPILNEGARLAIEVHAMVYPFAEELFGKKE